MQKDKFSHFYPRRWCKVKKYSIAIVDFYHSLTLFLLTSSILSSTLASQPLDEVFDTSLKVKPNNKIPLGSNSSSDNTIIFKFRINFSTIHQLHI